MAERRQLEWTVVHDVVDEKTGHTIRISRNNLATPGYSIQEGNKPTDGTADERLRPFNRIEVNWKVDPPKVVSLIERKSELQREAELWIAADAREQAGRKKRPT